MKNADELSVPSVYLECFSHTDNNKSPTAYLFILLNHYLKLWHVSRPYFHRLQSLFKENYVGGMVSS